MKSLSHNSFRQVMGSLQAPHLMLLFRQLRKTWSSHTFLLSLITVMIVKFLSSRHAWSHHWTRNAALALSTNALSHLHLFQLRSMFRVNDINAQPVDRHFYDSPEKKTRSHSARENIMQTPSSCLRCAVDKFMSNKRFEFSRFLGKWKFK